MLVRRAQVFTAIKACVQRCWQALVHLHNLIAAIRRVDGVASSRNIVRIRPFLGGTRKVTARTVRWVVFVPMALDLGFETAGERERQRDREREREREREIKLQKNTGR